MEKTNKTKKTKAFDKDYKPKIFIDGEVGTVGLNIRDRLNKRTDIELLKIDEDLRKDTLERKRLLNKADFVFLCLPDDAAREAVSLIDNPKVRVIDASTAHRTNDDWVYGFPELSETQYRGISASNRVAVPGCYASGFCAIVYPLVKSNMINADTLISCFGISGYSGAGKSAINQYESSDRNRELGGARIYALSQTHKHQSEMQKICGLKHIPMFNPIIDDYYNGMIVAIPLQFPGFSVDEAKKLYSEHYKNGRVKLCDEEGIDFLAANAVNDRDDMELYVFGNDERMLLAARFDNLGKGASGAAVQCFELMLEGEI